MGRPRASANKFLGMMC